jgi:hypothetical protein
MMLIVFKHDAKMKCLAGRECHIECDTFGWINQIRDDGELRFLDEFEDVGRGAVCHKGMIPE